MFEDLCIYYSGNSTLYIKDFAKYFQHHIHFPRNKTLHKKTFAKCLQHHTLARLNVVCEVKFNDNYKQALEKYEIP